jgi:ribonuclease HI
MMSRVLEFYTDGAYSSKSEMGGWAAICVEDNEIIDTQSGYEPYTTNNRMELTAFLCALECADTVETGRTKVVIYTDSAYVANCFNQGWFRNWMKNGWRTSDKQEVKNQDLWRRIVALYIKNKERLQIEIIKVQGHADNYFNNYVDLLAVNKRKELEL